MHHYSPIELLAQFKIRRPVVSVRCHLHRTHLEHGIARRKDPGIEEGIKFHAGVQFEGIAELLRGDGAVAQVRLNTAQGLLEQSIAEVAAEVMHH